MNQLSELKKILSNKNWQKFCAAEDWHVPEFKYVLNEFFTNNASYHRKQWEFVVIFLNLAIEGKLHQESVGASFGAGKEPLIYVLLPFVKSFLATDLYSWSTGWSTARMGQQDTPQDFLTRHAPNGLDIKNLTAKEMDMRTLDIPDNSLDFCYSSCAVEHIGHREDFIQHLSEVKRVLKDDGVYVMTTELLFDHDTIANKGNYKFDLAYLKDLLLEAGLDTKKVFDGSCDASRLNVPRPFIRPLVGGKKMEKLLPSAAILDMEGVAYTSCCFILSKSTGQTATFIEEGLASSAEFVNRKKHRNMLNMYESRRSLDPFYSLKKNCRLYLDDHISYRADQIENTPAIKLTQANFCFTDFIWFNQSTVHFHIAFKLGAFKGKINWILVEKEQLNLKTRKNIDKKVIQYKMDSGLLQLGFVFKAKPRMTYAVIGQVQKGLFKKNEPELVIEYLHIDARVT